MARNKGWTLRHKWGLEFEYKPEHNAVYAKWLRKVADRLDGLPAQDRGYAVTESGTP